MRPLRTCPFCEPDRGRIVLESDHAIALPDAFPLSDGHALVVPRRHVESVFALGPEEQADLWALVARVRLELVGEHGPDGFNVGVNDGAAAGQTVRHAHVHLIPRYDGDVADPRGGVRWVRPDRARYWRRMTDPAPARPPTAEEQLTFLRSLQRLLDEGSFVASYKYALLHAIADLCVVEGDDSGAALELSTRRIAEQFVRLYWRQVAPFIASGEADVLKQNTGRVAKGAPNRGADREGHAALEAPDRRGSHFVQRLNPGRLGQLVERAGGQVWVMGSELRELGAGWRASFVIRTDPTAR